ncbi:hypothetical protein [Endozoicomonas sp. SCSIO W0465]|uniref:hypothetical protein n=1 Tax=Endozoicomonas sp. SCSIO W0465 TaxID=2918516 RepID=UPI0020762B49|nr:hypothetical protein [Endozoicomonas sp. SCSIO W0465]USE37463.1 hypothetical protein MJO57_04360 [Endozoicomonas sp. SCSIO W0465]
MLRRTRFSLSLSEPGPKPTKKEWRCHRWPLIEDFATEDTDDADEYIHEWHFPYPGQKAFLRVDPAGPVNTTEPLMQKKFANGYIRKAPCDRRQDLTMVFLHKTASKRKDPIQK